MSDRDSDMWHWPSALLGLIIGLALGGFVVGITVDGCTVDKWNKLCVGKGIARYDANGEFEWLDEPKK